MGKKELEELYQLIDQEVAKLQFQFKEEYYAIFLKSMVKRKLKHPEEKMDKILQHTMQHMKKTSKKKDFVVIGKLKSFEDLEEVIINNEVAYELWQNATHMKEEEKEEASQFVSCIVKELVKKVIDAQSI